MPSVSNSTTGASKAKYSDIAVDTRPSDPATTCQHVGFSHKAETLHNFPEESLRLPVGTQSMGTLAGWPSRLCNIRRTSRRRSSRCSCLAFDPGSPASFKRSRSSCSAISASEKVITPAVGSSIGTSASQSLDSSLFRRSRSLRPSFAEVQAHCLQEVQLVNISGGDAQLPRSSEIK